MATLAPPSAILHAPAHLRALHTPARQEIVDTLDAAGPCSVARLAELIGRPADSLYHHLRRLVRVGLVVEERHKEGRHVFAIYRLQVRPLKLRYERPACSADVVGVVGAAHRLAWREFRRAMGRGDAITSGPRRTLWGARAKGWLSPDELERVNRLLGEVIELLRAGTPARGRVPVSASFLLAPSPPGVRAIRSKGRVG